MTVCTQEYNARDLSDWTEFAHAPFKFTSTFPLRTVLPLRVAIVNPRVIPCLYRAAWADDHNIGDPAVLHQVLTRAGFDAAALIAAADHADVKERLRANTADAVATGVCGVPTFQVVPAGAPPGELVWGQDRLHVVADMLNGWTSIAGAAAPAGPVSKL